MTNSCCGYDDHNTQKSVCFVIFFLRTFISYSFMISICMGKWELFNLGIHINFDTIIFFLFFLFESRVENIEVQK